MDEAVQERARQALGRSLHLNLDAAINNFLN
jgi:hypothetical protein